MKTLLLCILFPALSFATGLTQFKDSSFNGAVAVGKAAAADSKAIMDLVSTAKGLLIPRMTTTQRNAISSPTTGLIVYDTTVGGLFQYNGSWHQLASDGLTFTGSVTGTASGNTTYTPNNHGMVVSGSGNAMTVVAPDSSTTKVWTSGGLSADPSWQPGGSGTVSSVTFTGDGTVLSSTPSSAVTTTGTVTGSLNTHSANTVFAGPSSGSAATPTFRALAVADMPYKNAYVTNTGTDCTVAASPSGWITSHSRSATGRCTLNFSSTSFNACVATTATGGANVPTVNVTALSATSLSTETTINNGTAQDIDLNYYIVCFL